MEKKTFEAFDGKIITYRIWETEKPVGVLQISHGMAESGDRYCAFAEYMANKGFIVVADDHRGHGETDTGRTGYADGDIFNDTLKDLVTLNALIKKDYPDLPYILFGHSYGSFLTQAYIERYGDTIDGAVIGGSAYLNDFSVTSGRAVAKMNCLLGRKRKPAEFIKKLSFDAYNKKYTDGTTFISQIKDECDKYAAASDCNFTLSYAFYKSFFSALPKLYKEYSAIPKDLPILLIAGGGDPVGAYGNNVEKLYDFYVDEVGLEDVEKIIYPNVRHEYLNDVTRDDAQCEIAEFAKAVVAKKKA